MKLIFKSRASKRWPGLFLFDLILCFFLVDNRHLEVKKDFKTKEGPKERAILKIVSIYNPNSQLLFLGANSHNLTRNIL
jgi:hypothetical protein